MNDDNLSKIDGFYTRLRSQVEHENNIYNQRIVWLITIQAFLYATVGLLFQAKVDDHCDKYAVEIEWFTGLVCFIGMYVALISHKILTDARNALQHLRKIWNKQSANIPPSMADFYPHISGGDGKATTAFFLRSRNLPLLFALSWLVAAGIFFGPSAVQHWQDLARNGEIGKICKPCQNLIAKSN